MTDEYKKLKDFPNYRIYPDGRIYSEHSKKFLKPHYDGRGYMDVILYNASTNTRKPIKIHRLVACCFVDNPNNYPEINHIDKNKRNNHYLNLEWCSREYNVRYSTMEMSIAAQGNSPLTENMVRLIPILLRYHCSIKLIATLYKVGHITIRNIIKGKTWKNLNLTFPKNDYYKGIIELPIEIYNQLKSFNIDNTVLSNRIIPITSVTHRD